MYHLTHCFIVIILVSFLFIIAVLLIIFDTVTWVITYLNLLKLEYFVTIDHDICTFCLFFGRRTVWSIVDCDCYILDFLIFIHII